LRWRAGGQEKFDEALTESRIRATSAFEQPSLRSDTVESVEKGVSGGRRSSLRQSLNGLFKWKIERPSLERSRQLDPGEGMHKKDEED